MNLHANTTEKMQTQTMFAFTKSGALKKSKRNIWKIDFAMPTLVAAMFTTLKCADKQKNVQQQSTENRVLCKCRLATGDLTGGFPTKHKP